MRIPRRRVIRRRPPDSANKRAFWLLTAGSCASIDAVGSINQHMKLLFQDAGLTQATVADTTFAILTSSLAGRVMIGWLADRLSKKAVMITAFLFVAAPIPLLYIIDQPGMPMMFAIPFGFGFGAGYLLIPLMAAEVFGVNSLARRMGIVPPSDSNGADLISVPARSPALLLAQLRTRPACCHRARFRGRTCHRDAAVTTRPKC